MIFAAIASVLATLTLSIFLFWRLFFRDSDKSVAVKIPNLIGEHADAITAPEGFELEITYAYDGDGNGRVVSQSPPPDAVRKSYNREKIKIRLSVSAPSP